MKEIPLQIKLPGVPLAKQGREVAPQWEWTEAAVWTERMLATLERGILAELGLISLALARVKAANARKRGPLTGELDARNSPVQFGGRGRLKPCSYPYQNVAVVLVSTHS